jgi:hypothetical protein
VPVGSRATRGDRHRAVVTRTHELALVRAADLDPVAWQVLLRDGDLVELCPGTALPADVPVAPAHRAAARAPLVPRGAALARESAAWVHLGGPPPAVTHVVAPGHAPAPHPGRAGTGGSLPPRDVVLLGDVPVTTARRTALDLLLARPPAVAAPLVAALRDAGLDLGAVHADVASAAGRRGVRRAAATLARLRAAGPPAQPTTGSSAALAPVIR